MKKQAIWLVLALFITILVGCKSPPDEPPAPPPNLNVHQPATADTNCQEIEYSWKRGGQSDGQRFFVGSGDFCALLEDIDTDASQPLRARCVERDSSGTVIHAHKWIQHRSADEDEFRQLCPEFQRLVEHAQ